jgi:hypothetical protein
MDQTGVIATRREDRLDAIRVTERLKLGDELDLKPGLGDQPLALAGTSSRSGSAQRG